MTLIGTDDEARERLVERARAWRVDVEEIRETNSSIVGFGMCAGSAVVLKIVRARGDEWRSGEVLASFEGHGMARVLEHTGGAILLERLQPATPLASLVLEGRDEEATAILADVIGRMMIVSATTAGHVTAEEWGRGFDRYLTGNDRQISRDLVEHAGAIYRDLCASQQGVRLLHGDLQHYNVLYDAGRGWLAIDPKGVVGEMEYEIGAMLRNPCERPDLFLTAATVERRIGIFEGLLGLDAGRVLAWGFAQAVLSAIWTVEDGFDVASDDVSLRLAGVLRGMIK